MEHSADTGMLAALEQGPGTRLAVIERFVHRDGTLYLSARHTTTTAQGEPNADRPRTSSCPSGARVLEVHASPQNVAENAADDILVPHDYEAVLSAALTDDYDGLILHSGTAWITLARTEVSSALLRRRRLASKGRR